MDRTTQKSTGDTSQQFQTARSARRNWLWLAVFLFLASGVATSVAAPRFVPGQILVKPKAGLSETNFAGKLRGHGAIARRTLHRLNIRIVAVPEAQAEAALAALRNDPDIEFAERDFIAEAAYVPADPYVLSGSEWHLSRIQADQAWDSTTGSSNTIVAVLDSGVNAAHPDLASRILAGYDFVWNDSDPTDDFGHGTAVAGTVIACGNNGLGVAGVAYGCRLLPVKVMDASGFAYYSTIAQGIRYAVDSGARVINISIAGSSPSSTLQDAINYAWSRNVVIVAAAGNNANNVPQYPAACDHVVAVSATEPDDSLAGFSSYGNNVILSAPGDTIWTTQRDLSNPYGPWRGTSFASPIVAGVAALVASANPSLSSTQIVSVLEQSADDVGPAGYDVAFGYGRVNAANAVALASALPGGLPPQAPEPPNTNPAPTDIISPSVTVSAAPANGARVNSPIISLGGTASDNSGVDRVEVQINGGEAQIASGTTDWTAAISLLPGPNTVAVRSVDLSGNVSPAVTFTFTYVLNVPLTVGTSGYGTVTPNLNGRLLEVGKVYTMKAVPAAGQAFAGWSGVSSDSPVLTFTMQTNLTLVANFVSSPFPTVKGTYAGLVVNDKGVTPDSSGYFQLSVTPSGLFTGKVLLAGGRHGFRGQFNIGGDATVTVKRGSLEPLSMTLHVDLSNGTDQVTGSVTDGAWASDLAGDRNVFNAKLNPALQAGSRAFILERADNVPATAATGSSAISLAGAARVKGALNDGRAFSAASLLAKNGDCPFYLSLNRGSEVVIGWLNFPTTPTPTASGTVLWVRTGTNAFAATLQAASAP